MDWEASVPVEAHIHIVYRDANNQVTERKVTVSRFGEDMILGLCHLRNANRTFLFSRIQRMVDLDSGEVIKDGRAFLHARYLASPQGQIDAALERLSDQIDLLLYVAKADGRMLAPERRHICSFVMQHSEDLRIDESELDEVVKKLVPPSISEFKKTARRMAEASEEMRRTLLDIAQAIVATQKTVNPMEEAALQILEQAFKMHRRDDTKRERLTSAENSDKTSRSEP